MNFGEALIAMRYGDKVTRSGWNGQDMFIYLVNGSAFFIDREPLSKFYPQGTQVCYRPHIDMRTAQGDFVPWVASQTDLLADDWSVVK